jgi:hypothetical protein
MLASTGKSAVVQTVAANDSEKEGLWPIFFSRGGADVGHASSRLSWAIKRFCTDGVKIGPQPEKPLCGPYVDTVGIYTRNEYKTQPTIDKMDFELILPS